MVWRPEGRLAGRRVEYDLSERAARRGPAPAARFVYALLASWRFAPTEPALPAAVAAARR